VEETKKMKYTDSIWKLAAFLLLSLVLIGQGAAQSQDSVLARVEVTGNLNAVGMPIYAHLQDAATRNYALVMAPVSQLDKSGLVYAVLDLPAKKAENEGYFIALERRKGARQQAAQVTRVLHDDGRQIVVRATEKEVESLSMLGFDMEEITTPLVLRENAPAVSTLEFNATVAELIDKVQQPTVTSYDGNLSGEAVVSIGGASYTIRSRYTKSGEPITKATQYVYEFMQKQGLTVSYHDWQSWSSSSRNVIGNKLGTTKPKEIILITAHLDSMPSSSTNSPGADDNGSGSAGVMMAAEILTQYNFERTLRFVFFTGEEQGLLGSAAYATKVSQDGENIVAVYNMDMIAWDSTGGPTLRLHTRTTSNSGYAADKAIADLFINVAKTYSLNLTPILDPDGIGASDHASFWKKGYAGILAIEDDQDDFCANYHTSSDKLSTLNLSYCTRYIKATMGTIAHLAVLTN
jgi:leucyl aminopeptidase